MIPRGGVFDKIGNWYEQSLVMLQWLRLLKEDVQMVCWEPLGTPGEGVDYLIREGDHLVAVQCKTRRSGSWSPSDLEQPLQYARQRLDHDADRYRFLSNLRPSALAEAAEAAMRHEQADQWLAEDEGARRKFVSHLGCDPDEADELTVAFELFRRIDVQSQDQQALNERIREDVKLLAGDQRDSLLNLLYELAQPNTLGREWTAVDLHARVQQHGIQLLDHWDAISSVAWMEGLTDQFVRQIVASRRGRPQIPRPEAERLVQLGKQGSGVVLIHGPPGTGKSVVLAQAAASLREHGIPVLAIRADHLGHDDLDDDPIGRFRSLLGERGGCLVIDQLDQAAATGSALVLTITRMVQSAVRSGITVLVGCRSVDARQETALHQILFHLGSPPQEVPIGDYEEQVVADMLKPLGIPIDDLGPDLLALVRNPLALSLLMDLVERSGTWRVGNSTVDLVDQWCRQLARDYGESFLSLLDVIAQRMEAERVSSVDRHLLGDCFALLVDRLLEDGLLIDEGAGRVRLFHQIISDMRTALRWSGVDTSEDLLHLLGPRRDQGLRHARRARLTVQRLANRGPTGAAILRYVVWHPEVRVIVRRSLLLGLADLVDVPRALIGIVIDWLEEDDRRASILETVVRGQTPWIDVLDDWLDEAWSTWPDDQRNLLLDCCASVARRRGDLVARHLARWERESPGTIDRAHWAFWHDPSEDSEELFDLRLAHLASTQARRYPYDWPKLMEAHPIRSAKLLATMLERTPRDDLVDSSQPDWMHGFPSPGDVPDALLRSSVEVFGELERWWCHLEIDDLRFIRNKTFPGGPGPLVQIVDFLGKILARSVSLGRKTWAEVTTGLPDPLRPLDGWLLLLIGCHLDPEEAPRESFAAAAEWIRSDPKWVHTEIGFGSRTLSLAAACLGNISPHLDADDYGRLERWLIEYPDEWTVEQETYRWEMIKQYGAFWPNRRGATPYLLLPALDRSRWSTEAEATFALLERKFRDHGSMFEGSQSRGGWVGPKVPDHVADRYSIEQWIQHIGDAPEHDHNWSEIGEGSVGEHTQRMNASQLRRLAEQRPRAYLGLAEALPAYQDRLPSAAFAAIVDALGRTRRPDRADADWQPIDDQTFASIVCHPAYLDCDECSRELAMAIERRASFDWPDRVVERLVAVARSSDRRFEQQREHGLDEQLLQYRINDAACIALNAIAAIVGHHEYRRPQLLPIAEGLADHEDAGRRACAAMLAWECRAIDLDLAAGMVLIAASESFVAAQHDIHHVLRWLAQSDAVSEDIRYEAQRILLGLLDHEDAPRAEWGGIGALCLRTWDLLGHDRLTALLEANVVARRSAARVLAQWLGERDVPEWMKSYAMQLADDHDEQVGDHILWVFRGSDHAHLIEDDDFVVAMARTAAARRDSEHLIQACDEHGSLHRMADLVLALAEAVISDVKHTKDCWRDLRNAESTAGLLVRFVQEVEQRGELEAVRQALDMLDQMIAKGSIGSGNAWKLVASAANA